MSIDWWSNVLGVASVFVVPAVTLALGGVIFQINKVREKQATQEIERLKNENLTLSIQLEDLKKRVSSRGLSTLEKDTLASWTNVGGLIINRLGDQEASQYASEIHAAANRGKLVAKFTNIGGISPPIYGLHMRKADEDSEAAKALRAANLHVEFDDSVGAVRVPPPPGTAILLVGLKPPQI